MSRDCVFELRDIAKPAQIELQRKIELAKFLVAVSTEPTENTIFVIFFTEYDGYWEVIGGLEHKDMSNSSKRFWLLKRMFLKTKNDRRKAMWLLLSSQVTSTYKDTTDAIKTFQSGLDMEEAYTNVANVTVAHANAD